MGGSLRTHMYPEEHAATIMPLQRLSEDRIWSVTFLSKLRDKRSRWVSKCVMWIIVWTHSTEVRASICEWNAKKEQTHTSRSAWLLSKPLMQRRTSQFSSQFEPLAYLSFHVRHPATEKERTKIDRDQTLIMSELSSLSKLSLVLYQKTVIYWLCCRGLNACVGASHSQRGKVTE